MKKPLRIMLTLLFYIMILMCLTPVAFAETVGSGTWGENLTWVLDDAGVLTISGSGDMSDFPLSSSDAWKYYQYSKLIRTVSIESNITSIGQYAFSFCDNLENVALSDTVVNIGNNAFYCCGNLKNITLPASIVSIGNDAFYNCTSLESVEIPEGVTNVGSYAFYGCSSLTTAYIPSTLTERLKSHVFSECTSLVNVTAPSWRDFSSCPVVSLTVPSGVTKIANNAFEKCYSLDYISLPFGITSIGNTSFSNCKSLESIIIPGGVTDIGNNAFFGCIALKALILPSSIERIGYSVLSGCENLTDIYFGGSEDQWDEINFGSGNEILTSKDIVHFELIPYGECGAEGNNLTWTLDNNGTLTITGVGEMKDYAWYEISNHAPWETAFDLITKVEISAQVTSIGNSAFYSCNKLNEIEIPESIERIGDGAFLYCSNLRKVLIPANVTSMGDSTFGGCTELKTAGPIGSDCNIQFGWETTIPDNAFSSCTGLTDLVFPDSITHIGDYSVSACEALAEVMLPANLKSIGAYAFSNCKLLDGVELPSDVNIIGNWAFSGCSNLTSISIPDHVSSIASWSFADCTSLQSVDIPVSVSAIGENAFLGCANINDVWYGGSQAQWSALVASSVADGNTTLTKADVHYAAYNIIIDSQLTGGSIKAFLNSIPVISAVPGTKVTLEITPDSGYELETLSIKQGENNVIVEADMFEMPEGDVTVSATFIRTFVSSGVCGAQNDNLTWILYCDGELMIQGTGGMAEYDIGTAPWYSDRAKITTISIGNGVSNIGGYAFYYCNNMENIAIPQTVSSIGSYAFDNCSKLKEIIIPQGTISIGSYTFKDCSSVKKVTVPSSIASIGGFAFMNCTAMNAVYISSIEAWCSIDFGWEGSGNPLQYAHDLYLNGSLLQELILPSSISTIKTGAFYGSSLTDVTIPDGVTSIGGYAFMNCENLGTIVIPNSISSIGEFSFGQCPLLQSIIIPGNIAVIERYAFAGCTGLTEIIIEDGVTEIRYRAFRNCKNIESISIPESVISIGAEAFGQCEALSDISFSDGLTTIEYEAFRGCISLDNVVLPDSITTIGYGAFQNCASLSRIIIPEGLSRISHYAFYNCGSLSEINIPEGITSIDDYAFVGCVELTDLSFPNSLTNIGQSAFLNCTGLESLEFPNAVSQINHSCFRGCSSLKSITIPSSITIIQAKAFDGCTKLEDVYYDGTEAQWLEISIGDDNTYLREANRHYKCIAEGNCGAQGDNLTWILNNDGTLIISGTGDMASFANGGNWQEYPAKVKHLTIEPGVTSIGDNAFGHTGITSASLPEGITRLGAEAFYNCNNLETIYLPNSLMSISGYAFDGCSTLAHVYYNGTTIQWNSISKAGMNEPLSKAILHPSAYTVSYNGNGGSGVMDQLIVDRGTSFSLTPNSFIREGYYFIGWNTKPDGSGTAFFDQSTVNEIDEDIMLYAQWKNTVTISFNPNGGIGTMYPQVVGGSYVSLSRNRFIREDYSFVGWNTRADGTGIFYNDAAIVSGDEITSSTLYAQWEKTTFTIMFMSNGGTGTMEPQKLEKGKALALNSNTFVNDNMFFMEWNTRADGSGTSYADRSTINELDRDITLYAQWATPDFTLPAALTAIESEAFSGGVFSYVRLPETVISIGWHAFADCPNLAYIYIPALTTQIDEAAFGDLQGLTILGKAGSTAETYAQNHHFNFTAVP